MYGIVNLYLKFLGLKPMFVYFFPRDKSRGNSDKSRGNSDKSRGNSDKSRGNSDKS